MKTIKSAIQLHGIHLYGFHGVSEEEQSVGSWFEINVNIDAYVAESALVHDNLEGTIDYSIVMKIIKKVFSRKSRLLEHLAYNISKQLIERFDTISAVNIQVKKMAPPMPSNVDSSAIKLTVEA